MITERDNQIIRYFEEYKYADIKMIEKLFFPGQEYSYSICRRRLAKIRNTGFITSYRDTITNKYVYMYNEDKIKPPILHRMIVLKLYVELKYAGYDVELYEVEKFWCQGKYRSDAFLIFSIENRRYHFFVEVQTSNNAIDLEKYDRLYESGEVQNYLNKNFFPRVLLISDRKIDIKLTHTKVVYLSTKLSPLNSILL